MFETVLTENTHLCIMYYITVLLFILFKENFPLSTEKNKKGVLSYVHMCVHPCFFTFPVFI